MHLNNDKYNEIPSMHEDVRITADSNCKVTESHENTNLEVLTLWIQLLLLSTYMCMCRRKSSIVTMFD